MRALAVLFDGVKDLVESGESIDPVILGEHLEKAGTLARAGGAVTIVEVMTSSGDPGFVQTHVLAVRRYSQRRRIAAIAEQMVAQANDCTVDVDSIIGGATSELDALQAGPGDREQRVLADAIDAAKELPISFAEISLFAVESGGNALQFRQ